MGMRAVGAAVIAAALVIGLASPAAAQTKKSRDSSGDVTLVTYTKAGAPLIADDSSGLSDISSVTAKYTAKKLTFTVKYDKAAKKNVNQVGINLMTPGVNGRSYTVTWSARKASRDWNGVHRDGDDYETVIAPVTVTRTDGVLTASIPASAIGAPKSVSFSLTAGFSAEGKKPFYRNDTYPDMIPSPDGQSDYLVYKKIKKG